MLSGKVVDEFGDIIIGAQVRIDSLNCETQTDIDGLWQMTMHGNFSSTNNITLHAEQIGYLPVDTLFNLRDRFIKYAVRKFFVEITVSTPQPGPTIILNVDR